MNGYQEQKTQTLPASAKSANASTAGGRCQQTAPGGGVTAVQHVDNGRGGHVSRKPERKDGRNTANLSRKPDRKGGWYVPEGFTRNCDHCGREYLAKRDSSRFCGAVCRVAFWRAKQRGQS